MRREKPTAAIEVKFRGSGIVPEKIPLAILSRALSAVQRFASGDIEPDTQENSLGLFKVKRGSALFEVTAEAPSRAVANIRLVGRMIEEPDMANDVEYALGAIEDLSNVAKSLGCTITIKDPEQSGVLAKIEGGTYGRVAHSMLIQGETTIVGSVQRVGGAEEPRCMLRIPSQPRLIFCGVKDTEIARMLAQHLYEDVAVTGTAKWLRHSWRVVSFDISGMQPRRNGTLADAFVALREAGGKDWDDIGDPVAFLRETTGE